MTTPEFRAMRCLENLTPGGSEYFNDPARCAKWIVDRLTNAQRLTVKAVSEKHAAIARAEAAEAERDALMKMVERLAGGYDVLSECHILPENYIDEARALADEARALLAAAGRTPGRGEGE